MTRPSTTATSRCLLALVCLAVAGCGVLKPSGFTPRTFLLTPALATNAPPAKPSSFTRGLGLGYVKVPDYLFGRAMAMRKGQHEILYLEHAVWAERLDHAFQRVLAANLTALLPTCEVRLSSWRPDEVTDEVHVSVQRFDVDAAGTCTLEAWWRIVPPGGGQPRSSGHFLRHASGAAPDTDSEGAVASMNALAAELSRVIAHALDGDGSPTAESRH